MTQTSKEYAEALFALALESNETEETSTALELINEVLNQEPDFAALLKSPAVPRDVRISTLGEAFEGKVPKTVLAVIRMLCVKGHLSCLQEMTVEYEKLNRQHQGVTIANVTSAVALTNQEKADLKAKLEGTFSCKVELICNQDPALLGGVRVEIDGKVIDGSIRNKLQQIKEVMKP